MDIPIKCAFCGRILVMVQFQFNNIENVLLCIGNCKIDQYTVNWTMSGRRVYHYLSREQLYHRGRIRDICETNNP